MTDPMQQLIRCVEGLIPTMAMRRVDTSKIEACLAAAKAAPASRGDAVAIRDALVEAEEVLSLMEHPRQVDPLFGSEVKSLGDRIGYGALMSSAEALWREANAARGNPGGAEHVSGPCRASVERALRIVREALRAEPKPQVVHISAIGGGYTMCGIDFESSVKRVRERQGATCQDCLSIDDAAEEASEPEPSIAELRKQRDTLTRLAVSLIQVNCWDDGPGIDGGELQDMAEELGIIIPVPGGFDPDLHTDNGWGAKRGDPYFELAPWVDEIVNAKELEGRAVTEGDPR